MRLAVFLLLLSVFASGQEVCKHCPVGADLDQQFPRQETYGHWFTKKYLVAEGFHVGAGIFDIQETLHGEHAGCFLEGSNGFPERVGGKELGWEFAAETGASIAGRWLLAHGDPPRWARAFSFIGPAYGTALHLKGGIEWYSRCR